MKSIFLIALLLCFTGLSIAQMSNTVYVPYNLNHRWGFADTNGVILIKPEFDSVGMFDRGYANAYKDEKVGMINTKGKWIVPPKYKFVELLDLKQHLFEVTIYKDKQSGDYIRLSGIYKESVGIIAPVKYSYFNRHNANNYVMEGDNGKNYLLNVRTHKITVFKHKHYFDCGCARLQKRLQRYDEMKIRAEELVKKYLFKKPPLEEIGKLNLIKLNGKTGGYIVYDTLFDKKKNRWKKYTDSFPVIYDSITPLDEENKIFYVQLKGKWGVLNAKGRTVISPEYSMISFQGYGFASKKYFVVNKDGKQGVISFNGFIVVPCTQDSVVVKCGYMSCFFSVKKNNKWSVVNNRGIFITDYFSDEPVILNYWADHYKYMVMKQNGKFGVIDTTGKLIHPAVYDDIKIQDNSFMITRKGKFYGVKKISNPNEGLEAEWDTVRSVSSESHFRLQKNNLHGIYDQIKPLMERHLYFPISDEPYFSLEHCISANEKVQFAIFGFEKGDKFYYVGENGVRFTKD